MSFFEGIQNMTAPEAETACRTEKSTIQTEINHLKAERFATPRGDKQAAHLLQQKINTLEAQLKRVTNVHKVYRAKAEAQEEHGLWKLSVRVVAGDEVLEKCIAWMKQEKRRRALEELPIAANLTPVCAGDGNTYAVSERPMVKG